MRLHLARRAESPELADPAPIRSAQLALVLVGVCAALAPTNALAQPSGGVVIDGRGFGHGVGMSQYGAYGQALQDGAQFDEILGYYYRGTRLATHRQRRVRVLLGEAAGMRIRGARLVRSTRGRPIRLDPARVYAMRLIRRRWLSVTDARTGRHVGRWRGSLRLTGPRRICATRPRGGQLAPGCYRGRLQLTTSGRRFQVINVVGIEEYLYGVVPAEMHATWPLEALKAQAVAARSYALRRVRNGTQFDLYADTRSQAYGGTAGERRTTTRAVNETRGLVVTYEGEIADTLFFSSSGGRTAASEEVFGTAVTYLRSVDDPDDSLSPYHHWQVSFGAAELSRRLDGHVRGTLRDLAVIRRTASGRVALARIRGTEGDTELSGPQLQAALGLRSTWFDVRPR